MLHVRECANAIGQHSDFVPVNVQELERAQSCDLSRQRRQLVAVKVLKREWKKKRATF